ncbi:MAG: Coq4 family protein [Cyanobacteriota bacterium]|nr:Coq4 family protein [Cyanobacteriota bacterium]
MKDSGLQFILKLAQTINPQVNTDNLIEIDLNALRQLPAGTLGREVANFLDQNGFEPLNSGDWIQRTHDVWHVLTGLSPSTEDELMLQAFTRAQLFRPSCAIIVLLGLLSRRCSWRDIFTALKYGKMAERIVEWDLEADWATPLDDVRAKLRIVPLRFQPELSSVVSS